MNYNFSSIKMKKHILLTGPPGIGKTTALIKTCNILKQKNVNVDGFYTEELRDQYNNRIGFDIVTLENNRAKLARKTELIGVNEVTNFKIGQYTVYPTELEKLTLSLLRKNSKDILVIDEIGKMELLSNYFQKTVEQLFDKSERPIFATIPVAKGTPIPLVESLRRSHKCKVITVNRANRNQIVTDIVNYFLQKPLSS